MQEKDLYEYAVIRIVPKVEREEFVNVGVILFCPKQKFLQCQCHIDENKLSSFSSEIDIENIRQNLQALDHICAGSKAGGPIARLDMPSRFRWLTATRSTMVQTSKVHPGLCTDAKETLEKLFKEMVL